MVTRHLDPPAHHRGKGRHQRAALRGRAPVCRATQRVLVGEELVEGGAVRRSSATVSVPDWS